MKKALSLLLVMFLLITTSCAGDNSVIKKPSDIVGTPDRIYVVKNCAETIYEKGSAKYSDILSKTKNRFPHALKEAASAIPWLNDDGTFNFTAMAQDIDYIRFFYDNTQVVKLDCFASSMYSPMQISYNDLIFPMQDETFIVGNKTFGVLENE